jgi:heme exporter protein C
VLALVGIVNIPIIHFSVQWWNTLHQGASVSRMDAPSIDPGMLWPLLMMAAAFKSFYALALLRRVRCELLTRERHTGWVRQYVMEAGYA